MMSGAVALLEEQMSDGDGDTAACAVEFQIEKKRAPALVEAAPKRRLQHSEKGEEGYAVKHRNPAGAAGDEGS